MPRDDVYNPTSRIAKSYFAKAIPSHFDENGQKVYVAQFAYPGEHPQFVREYGQMIEYGSELEAYTAACVALTEKLKSRSTSQHRKHTYERMHRDNLREEMIRNNISYRKLAFIYGTTELRVLKWLEGTEDIPHPLNLLFFALEHHPDLLDVFVQVSRECTGRGNDAA